MAGSSLIYVTDQLRQARNNEVQVDTSNNIKSNMDAITLLGHAFVELSYARREVIKPNLNREFMGLCSDKVPVTTNLFGHELES